MTEAKIIAAIRGLKASRKNSLAGDDIGCFSGGARTYAATDSVIAGVHFEHAWLGPKDIAYKLFARNWSDFLVKGIKPEFALLNLALGTQSAEREFLLPFLRALDRLLIAQNITLIGGDTARSNADVFTLTFLGYRGKFIPRHARTVRVGDAVVQIGAVGGASYALRQLLRTATPSPAHLRFFARPQILPSLPHAHYLKATIDQSDSVAKSLRLLAEANAITLRVDSEAILRSHSAVAGFPHILAAAEDLALFAIADAKILAAPLKLTPAFRVIGNVSSIRCKQPSVAYTLSQKIVFSDRGQSLPSGDEFEHFERDA
ncbi:MAG: hypothetical protein JSR44_11310 [Spirochaetes bacterium]|nr:hypothetical protein [Spirochaetota bacterium]